ncbi:hypothetical protein CJF31_00005173 [Rutstroemia sp. NJR-2017a BVV2]|nr:hypothetical protein CJF31_00005173 [Rutstroemia sp. NJR-2017a BVV2]
MAAAKPAMMSGGLTAGVENEAAGEMDDLIMDDVGGGVPPRSKSPVQGTIPRTKFAEAYRSVFTLNPRANRPSTLFAHLNCNYLSTKGHAPTLLELKQHAQALVILIKQIAISTSIGVVDNQNAYPDEDVPRFNPNEAFDFLNDLNHVYENNTVHHNLPLVSLLNTIEAPQYPDGMMPNPEQPGELTEIDICPLHPVKPAPLNGPSLPYATHEALLKHANEALELIDHEFGAKGGLLGVLPPEDDKSNRPLAESTLLGQMILYIQRLVARLHNLERLYANSLDVLKGEATIPYQALSHIGVGGRSGRELVYPQDRFVLVNAGNDIWQSLNSEFEKQELIDEEVQTNFFHQGVEGERLWDQKDGKEISQGLTYLNIPTRYYRFRNHSLKSVFIIPGHAAHPGTQATREMESRPTVVSVVNPVWSERASIWERKVRADVEELQRVRSENEQLREAAESAANERKFLVKEVQARRSDNFRLREEISGLKAAEPERAAEVERMVLEREELSGLWGELRKREEGLRKDREMFADAQRAAGYAASEVQRERMAEMSAYKERREELELEYRKRVEELEGEKAAVT